MAKKMIEIGGRLHDVSTDHVVAGADEILYEPTNGTPKKQSEVNVETYEHVANINAALQELNPDQTEALALATDVNDLKDNVVRSDVQTLTDAQKAQALANVGISGIEDEPTAGSEKLVKSGGIQNELALGAVYDVSAKNPTAGLNSDGKWESLSALLSDANLNTLIPTAVRKGGMSVKFVQSSDNKYIQARCMAQNFTTDVTLWQGVDDEPTTGSENLVKSGSVADEFKKINDKVFGEEVSVDTSNILTSTTWSPTDEFPSSNFIKLFKGSYLVTFLKGDIELNSSVSNRQIQIITRHEGEEPSVVFYMTSPADETTTITVNEDDTYLWVRARGYLSGTATLKAQYVRPLDDVVVKTTAQTLNSSQKTTARENIDAKNVSISNSLLSIEGKNVSPLFRYECAYADNVEAKYYPLYGILRGGIKYVIDIISDTATPIYSLYTATSATSSARVDTIVGSTNISVGHNLFAFSPSADLIGGYININDDDTLVSANVSIKIYLTESDLHTTPRERYNFDLDSYDRLKAQVIRQGTSTEAPCITFKHKIGDTFYAHLRVKFPTDVHDEHTPDEVRELFRISNGTNVFTAKLVKDKPFTPTGSEPSSDSQIPVPRYQCGVHCVKDNESSTNKNSLVPDGWRRMFLIGEDAMSIRFAGDCSISDNQDIRIKIDDTAITIFHNNTQQTIASYAKVDYVAPDFDATATYHRNDVMMYGGDRWICCVDTATVGDKLPNEWYRQSEIAAIYEKMLEDTEEGGVLEDFEVNWYNVARLSYDDLIRCEVRLVGLYKRYAVGDTPQNPTLTAYDAFPFYFATKEKDRIYDIEIALNNKAIWAKSQCIIDGYGIEFGHYYSDELFNKECIITIGEESFARTLRNPKIIDFEISDELKFKYPLLRVYYAESVTPGIADNTSTYFTSESRLCELADYLEQHSYGYASLKDAINYINGGTQLPKGNIYHFTHDDTGLEWFTRESFDRIAQTYLRHHIIPSFATITDDNYDSVKDKINEMQNIGFYFYIHTLPNDLATKSAGYISYNELIGGIELARTKFKDNFGFYPLVWSFHQVNQNYNCVKALITRGFQIIFADNGNNTINKISRYRIRRTPFRNSDNLGAQIYKHIENYLQEDI